ncbi:hypothetical protein C7M84_002902 [Penaeus vannamei]|uniref:Uncharacterized protein n=1 Tax=Penaeus vannamei TaxID=6689 RepID=A0A3R7SWC5_PENVA|nr:hypothetical protein C7M84_002902 [Penaeus vannamei]
MDEILDPIPRIHSRGRMITFGPLNPLGQSRKCHSDGRSARSVQAGVAVKRGQERFRDTAEVFDPAETNLTSMDLDPIKHTTRSPCPVTQASVLLQGPSLTRSWTRDFSILPHSGGGLKDCYAEAGHRGDGPESIISTSIRAEGWNSCHVTSRLSLMQNEENARAAGGTSTPSPALSSSVLGLYPFAQRILILVFILASPFSTLSSYCSLSIYFSFHFLFSPHTLHISPHTSLHSSLRLSLSLHTLPLQATSPPPPSLPSPSRTFPSLHSPLPLPPSLPPFTLQVPSHSLHSCLPLFPPQISLPPPFPPRLSLPPLFPSTNLSPSPFPSTNFSPPLSLSLFSSFYAFFSPSLRRLFICHGLFHIIRLRDIYAFKYPSA